MLPTTIISRDNAHLFFPHHGYASLKGVPEMY